VPAAKAWLANPANKDYFAANVSNVFINAANEAEFPLPIVEGDRLTVVEEVVSVSPEKQTKLGVGHFIETMDTFTRQDGAVVATNRNTLFRFTPAAS